MDRKIRIARVPSSITLERWPTSGAHRGSKMGTMAIGRAWVTFPVVRLSSARLPLPRFWQTLVAVCWAITALHGGLCRTALVDAAPRGIEACYCCGRTADSASSRGSTPAADECSNCQACLGSTTEGVLIPYVAHYGLVVPRPASSAGSERDATSSPISPTPPRSDSRSAVHTAALVCCPNAPPHPRA